MDIVVFMFFWCLSFFWLVSNVRRVEVAYLFPLFITEVQEGLLSQEISSILCGMYSVIFVFEMHSIQFQTN